MPVVFTDNNVNIIKAKYSPNDSISVATIYDVAVSDRNILWRDRIENIIGIVPKRKLDMVISRLLSKEIFLQTYYELEAGAYFKDGGYNLEYDKKISGKTPDWLISKDGTEFIVEVFTVFDREEDQIKLRKTITNFIQSGGAVSEGVVIYTPQEKVRTRILDKYNKYKDFGKPIILICYDQTESSMNDFVFNNILYGDAAFDVLTEFHQGVVATSGWYRKDNGVFTQKTPENLSAVLFFKKGNTGIQERLYSNPTARIKYPLN